jgi:hypothetical protein
MEWYEARLTNTEADAALKAAGILKCWMDWNREDIDKAEEVLSKAVKAKAARLQRKA